jgi:hypothetical protein
MGLINKTALVTGATSGIGYHPKENLYHLPDKITREFKSQSTCRPKDLSLTGV